MSSTTMGPSLASSDDSALLLLARLLHGQAPRRLALAGRLLGEMGSLWHLRHAGLGALLRQGLSKPESARLLAALELGARACAPPALGPSIGGPEDAYPVVSPRLLGLSHERFVVLSVDVRNRPRAIAVAAEGAQDQCTVDPRQVFRLALAEAAAGIIVAHNHPSGDPTPSAHDLLLTRRLKRAGDLVGIALLDHLIIGSAGSGLAPAYRSLAQDGLLDGSRHGDSVCRPARD